MKINVIGPNFGPVEGGTEVDIEVQDLDEDTLTFVTVYFGNEPATDVVLKEWDEETETGTITATSPPAKAGKVDISVTTPGETEHAEEKAAFTYGPREERVRRVARQPQRKRGRQRKRSQRPSTRSPKSEQPKAVAKERTE